jgi:hypothetical protein
MSIVLATEFVFTTQKGAAHTAADAVVVRGGVDRDEFFAGAGHTCFLLEVRQTVLG